MAMRHVLRQCLASAAFVTLVFARGDRVEQMGSHKPAGTCQAETRDSATTEVDQLTMLQRKIQLDSDSNDINSITCAEGFVPAYGDDCPQKELEVTTTPAPFCEDGMSASGNPCEGKIHIKEETSRITRPCQRASGADCEGDFKVKYRTTSEDKDGNWVPFKREMSRDGGETWKPLPLLSELATSYGPEGCCVPAPTTPGPEPSEACVMGPWKDWSACSVTEGLGSRSRSRDVLSVKGPSGTCPCQKEAETCEEGKSDGLDVTTTAAPPTVEVCGYVKDVSDHNVKLEGVKVTTFSGETSTTKKDGKFCFQLPVGKATFSAEKEGYATEKDVVREVVAGKSTVRDIEMSSSLRDDQWRIVMKWKNKPQDLDSWTMFGKGSKEEQEVFEEHSAVGRWDAEQCDRYCSKKTPSACVMNWMWKRDANAQKVDHEVKCSTSGVSAQMDQDNKDITKYDYAETTTLSGVGDTCGEDCNIHFCVYQYAEKNPGGQEISESGATVEVYTGEQGKATKKDAFRIEDGDGYVKHITDKDPKYPGSGTSQWFVFSIDAKSKQVTQCKDPASPCAKTPCGQNHAR